jgi:hypothetical protein
LRKKRAKLRRHIADAERRINIAIIRRMVELKNDPVQSAIIDELAERDVHNMGTNRVAYIRTTLASLKRCDDVVKVGPQEIL